MSEDVIIGIDLGTTNSEVAAFVDGRVEILGPGPRAMLPSCVGIAAGGELLVGAPARNQQMLRPEHTVCSIKRKMGRDEKVTLGKKSFSPQEISSLILRRLVDWASDALGQRPQRAVITVPAYFQDAQRQATREAGELAGLQVVRIVNEPTAASLAYGCGLDGKTLMVYDLGGGTFDVSIVRIEGDVTEVLASHGNNRLGGDDFTRLLMERMVQAVSEQHQVVLGPEHDAALSRLWWAAEEAKKELSESPRVEVSEENLAVVDGRPLHLSLGVGREEYERLISPLVETTMESVTRALSDAELGARDVDEILLVGGSTRTPVIQEMLQERSGKAPRHDVHPDLCVALGAGVLAARLSGRDVQQVLVDVSPYSFGIEHLGELDGRPYEHCYHPIIPRNTPLPVTRTESYYTTVPNQSAAAIHVYQGEHADAMNDVPLGRFNVEGLTLMQDANEILVQMNLDLEGILRVQATEKCTGKARHITITEAARRMTEEEIARMRRSLASLYASLGGEDEPDAGPEDAGTEGTTVVDLSASGGARGTGLDRDEIARRGRELVKRSRVLLERMHPDDRVEAVDLNERVLDAIERGDDEDLGEAMHELEEMLFFVEGRG